MKSSPEIDKASTAPTVKALSEESQIAKKGTIVNNSTALTIAGTSVRQVNGLYSLNDLHKAAGKEEKNKPSGWMRNQQTQDLVAEISKAGIPAFETKRGNGAGVYTCKELVIAYAAWISAAFHLKVIRVFLSVATQQPDPVQASLDYDRIKPAQAQDLKEIIQAIVNAGIQTHGATWMRLQNKFKVNSYLALHPDQYEAARAYLIAKLPTGYSNVIVEDAPKLAAPDHNLAFALANQAAGFFAEVVGQVQAQAVEGLSGPAHPAAQMATEQLAADRAKPA